jgi:L-asparaginase
VISNKSLKKVVVLGTGGTIAGTASNAADNLGYTAAQIGVEQLLDAVPGIANVLGGHALQCEQLAQVDSKDMNVDIWLKLAQRVVQSLAQADVVGVVITHGTDTLEETAFFLQTVLPPTLINIKPVVLTCAMRPASAQNPDGPQNLMDAVSVALTAQAHGVVAVCAGTVHTSFDVQKAHTYRLDAFSSGDAGALAYVEEGKVRLLRNWPSAQVNKAQKAIENIAKMNQFPRVEIVMSHAGCSGAVVDALLLTAPGILPLRGLVVAATGNGTIHQDLIAALKRAQAQGVQIVRASRCVNGHVLATEHDDFAHSHGLSPVKARIALMLSLGEFA